MRACFFKSAIGNRQSAIRSGFSFAEVMFAVVVLGIGFIMLASIFPVAIRQTASVVEENDGTALTKRAAEKLREALVNSDDFPDLPSTAQPIVLPPLGFIGYAPGRMMAMPDLRFMVDDDTTPDPPGPAWPNQGSLGVQNRIYAAIKSRMISDDDGRYAFVPMYRRDRLADGTPSPWIQLTIVAMQNRTGRNYDPTLDLPLPHSAPGAIPPQDFPDPTLQPDDEVPTFWPRPVEVALIEGIGEPDRITIRDIGENDVPPGDSVRLPVIDAWRAAAEGAYVVISDSRVPVTAQNIAAGLVGRSNGRVYRLGNEVPSDGSAATADEVTFELVPGEDMQFLDPDRIPNNGDEIHEQLPHRPIGTTVGATGWAYAFIAGGRPIREATRPYDPNANPYEGLSQAVTAFTTFIQVK